MIDITYTKIIAVIMIIIAVKLFLDHRRKGYEGKYKPFGNYENITVVKHDLFKVFTAELLPLLVFGLASGEKFYNSSDPLNSWVGKTMVILSGYFVYHELVQPYLVSRLPYW